MQIVDIRPSLCGSAREGESLHLMERCMAGETLLPKEAVRLLPSREQFVRLWRMLERTVPKEGVQTPYLPTYARWPRSCPEPSRSCARRSVWRFSGSAGSFPSRAAATI